MYNGRQTTATVFHSLCLFVAAAVPALECRVLVHQIIKAVLEALVLAVQVFDLFLQLFILVLCLGHRLLHIQGAGS